MTLAAQRREVSCLALTFFYDYLEARGWPRRTIQEGLPYTPEFLDARLNWIDFASFLEIERRFGALFPENPDVFFDVGRSIKSTNGMGFLTAVVRTMFSPHQVYRQMPRFVPRFLFPFVNIRFDVSGRGTLRGTYLFEPGYAPTDGFLQTVRGILSGVPAMVGAPYAEVALTRDSELRAVFDIRVAGWRGAGESLRSVWARLRDSLAMRWQNRRRIAAELEETNSLLLQKVDDLTRAKADLDARVRDLTILSRLATYATSELDLRRLVRAAVNVVSEQLGQRPVATLLLDGEGDQAVLTIAATANLSSAALLGVTHALPALAGPEGRGGDDGRIELARQPWLVLGLRARDRELGVLLVGWREEQRVEPSLLASIAGQIAVAIDNAVSFRVIADLRDTLETRVATRTAELLDARSRLEATVLDLQRADKAKQDFFMNVSHELKTPLTLILASLDEFEMTASHALGAEALGGIRRNATNLLQLVEEILDFSRLDEGRLVARKVRFDLGEYVEHVVTLLRPLAERRRIELVCVRPDGVLPVLVEPNLLQRVLRNLIVNAVKYIDEGGHVRVSVSAEGAFVRFEVLDDGPGIPTEQADRVFERFYRCRAEGTQNVEGSGIGLAMAREIMELHDGRLTLESTPARGCLFRGELALSLDEAEPMLLVEELIEAPVGEGAEPAARDPRKSAAPPALAADAPHVLVVEDNHEMREVLARLLARRFQVTVASDGAEGLAAARGQLPDLVLADVNMPRMTGYQMCRALKDDPITRDIPVILLTARHGTQAALEGFGSGADDYVAKPFSAPELLARVGAHLRLRGLMQALVRAENRATLATLSAGIAHEILNPVNGIVNGVPPARKALRRLAIGEDIERQLATGESMLTVIESCGRRIQRIVDAVSGLARRSAAYAHAGSVTIGAQLDDILALLAHRRGPRVEVLVELAWDGPVACQPDLLDQVFVNLLANAFDALGAAGRVRIASERSGADVVVRVQDDGPGVPVSLREQIFRPFFTTKEVGKGMGMGLAMVREFLQAHGGSIVLATVSEWSTEFVVRLPAAGASPTTPPPARTRALPN